MFTYSPKQWLGKHAAAIISLLIAANRTSKKNLVRILDNVKNEMYITTISGDVPWRPYQEEISEANLATFAQDSTLKFSDATVRPVKIMAMDKFLMDQLRNTRFAADIKQGAANIDSNEFRQAVLAYLIPILGKSFERLFYNSVTATTKAAIAASSATAAQKAWAAAQPDGLVDGILANMIANGNVIAVAGTSVTATNIVAEYEKIYAALPGVVAGNPDTRMFVPESDFSLVLQANRNQQYRDIFTVQGNGLENATVTFSGLELEFVPQPGRFAGRAGSSGDFVLATDKAGDENEFTIDKVNNLGDAMFGKAVATLDAEVLLPQQKVLYL
ncbi:hypothetical protein Q5H92_08950 [Hymenobacter sp. M29]|uniref:Uncharacterized protein n=1 Tax=Hymenobacter mellowenesis TaxID=3063995 RepID=A0ABT9AA95_9BACT|nr:hypothetical protein [Hymenobacter sp. M29]MDO7846483.1 hypothetical protein [Hymenobacter sp. M29]